MNLNKIEDRNLEIRHKQLNREQTIVINRLEHNIESTKQELDKNKLAREIIQRNKEKMYADNLKALLGTTQEINIGQFYSAKKFSAFYNLQQNQRKKTPNSMQSSKRSSRLSKKSSTKSSIKHQEQIPIVKKAFNIEDIDNDDFDILKILREANSKCQEIIDLSDNDDNDDKTLVEDKEFRNNRKTFCLSAPIVNRNRTKL